MANSFPTAADYLSAYAPGGDGLVPTPVVDRATGRVQTLASLLRPAPEGARSKRLRMADVMIRRVSAVGNFTHEDLVAGGFDEAEIATHWRKALAIAGLHRMGADLP
jgi:hypothetical protein